MKINKINLALLFSIAFIRPFGFMLYLTSMPALVKYFHTSTGMLLQTLTFYFLGVGVSELYFGFLSDKFGRKRILVIGLFCFSITNFLSIFSCSIMQFIIFRILQGLSFGFTLSVLYACFKDIYSDGKMLSRLITFSETLFGVCAIVAPFLGSFIYVYFSWRGNFMFTSIISIILCILISLFYNNVERKEKIRRNIFTVYKGFLLNKKFMSLAIMCLLACASISIQNAEMPFINSSVLKLAPIFSGFVLFGFGFMYLLGNIANFYFLKVFKIRIIINII
ncbi:MAG: multidrug effflux MFS transporter, partial [bacterium]|nr:multidrug effflux MFS transporter [bacterium]